MVDGPVKGAPVGLGLGVKPECGAPGVSSRAGGGAGVTFSRSCWYTCYSFVMSQIDISLIMEIRGCLGYLLASGWNVWGPP